VHEHVAGIGVHKDMIKVAIRFPGEKNTRKTEILEFRTFYGVLQEVARLLRWRGCPGAGWCAGRTSRRRSRRRCGT